MTPGDAARDRSLSTDALLRILEQVDPSTPFHRHAAALLDELLIQKPSGGVPAATPRGPRRLLSIGMSTYDDYDGVYFSVQAIRLYHPEVTDCTEILVVDNHPRGPCAQPLKDLDGHIAGYRYVPFERVQGTAVRDLVFREANAEFVLCIDSHVLFRPGALARLVDYLGGCAGSLDLWQGPLIGDDLSVHGTHFDPVWRAGMFGAWATDPRGLDPDAPPFEIPMQGLGAFGCRQAAWPGFNPRLRGFGGEEGYLHEKIRRGGGRILCLPFLGWTHRFSRPFGPRYSVGIEDRVRNYLLIHDELGQDPAPAIEHFEREFGAERVRPLVASAQEELRGPFHVFDAIYCISPERESVGWDRAMRQCRALGIEHRVRRFPAIETPRHPDIGCALSHRAVVAEARWLGLGNVLVIEEGVLFSHRTPERLARTLAELAGRPWRLLSLGAPGRDEPANGAAVRPARDRVGLYALAYHRSAYDRVLSEIPDTPTAAARWLSAGEGLDRRLARTFGPMSLVACPSAATLPELLADERPAFDPLPLTS